MPGSEAAFIAVGVIGFAVLALGLLLGEFIEHEFEISHEAVFGHDLGQPADDAGPSWLSVRVIAASMVGFGAVGYATSSLGLPTVISWPAAAVGFFAVGAGTYFAVLRPLASQQYNSLLSRYSYVGCEAIVTLEITSGGIGQVSFRDRHGARVTQTARSDLDAAVTKGTAVQIVDLASDGVVVHHNSLSH